MSAFLESRAALLRRRPLVVGTLTGRHDLSSQLRRAASPWVDVIEVRLDTFPQISTPSGRSFAARLLERIRRSRKPLLLTLRSHTESGAISSRARRLSDHDRERLLAPLLPFAALVDVESRRRDFARRVTALARRARVGVIHSFHDFRTLTRFSVLDHWRAQAERAGADLYKVAVTPKDGPELAKFLSWGLGIKKIRSVLIGMGKIGAPSRTIGFSFGSVLTYGHLGASAAPGQVEAVKLGRVVRSIYGSAR